MVRKIYNLGVITFIDRENISEKKKNRILEEEKTLSLSTLAKEKMEH